MTAIHRLDRFFNRYTITGRLKTRTALHIGIGTESLHPAAVDSPVVKDVMGRPFIPGSSLKGAWRSYMERVLAAGWGRGADVPVCDIFRSPCLKDLKKEDRQDIDDLPDYLYARLCQVCRLFGNQNFAGRVLVRDLPVVLDTWVGFYENRSGVGIDRDTRTKVDGVLYDFETVPAGTEFDFQVVAENLDEDAWYNLLLGLRALAEGDIALGGKTSRGLGQVFLKDIVINLVTQQNLPQAIFQGQGENFTLNEALQQVGLPPAGETVVSRAALQKALAAGSGELTWSEALSLLRQAGGGK